MDLLKFLFTYCVCTHVLGDVSAHVRVAEWGSENSLMEPTVSSLSFSLETGMRSPGLSSRCQSSRWLSHLGTICLSSQNGGSQPLPYRAPLNSRGPAKLYTFWLSSITRLCGRFSFLPLYTLARPSSLWLHPSYKTHCPIPVAPALGMLLSASFCSDPQLQLTLD